MSIAHLVLSLIDAAAYDAVFNRPWRSNGYRPEFVDAFFKVDDYLLDEVYL